VAEARVASRSLTSRLLRPSQAKRRSTTHRLGWTAKPTGSTVYPGLPKTIDKLNGTHRGRGVAGSRSVSYLLPNR
jgi:hypothetical protein